MRFGAMNFPDRTVLEEIDAFGALQMDSLEPDRDSPMAHYSYYHRAVLGSLALQAKA